MDKIGNGNQCDDNIRLMTTYRIIFPTSDTVSLLTVDNCLILIAALISLCEYDRCTVITNTVHAHSAPKYIVNQDQLQLGTWQ